MGAWKVSTGRASVEVEATNWLAALGSAVSELGLGSGALGRLVCTVNPDGTASAFDPSSGTRFEVGPVESGDAPPPLFSMPGSSFAAQLASVPAPRPTPPPAAAPAPEPPPLTMPAPPVAEPVEAGAEPIEPFDLEILDEADPDDIPRPSAGEVPVADRMFVVFERCADIASARDTRTACRTALTLLADLVPADAGAVLVRSRVGDTLSFAAAYGPRASRILDTSIPADQGIAGFVHGFGLALVVGDVRQEPRFFRGVDRQSGYRTRSVLAVPINGGSGATWGCMELLNAPAGFQDEDVELARIVAGSLGSWLDQVLG